MTAIIAAGLALVILWAVLTAWKTVPGGTKGSGSGSRVEGSEVHPFFMLKAYRFDSSLEMREMIAALNQLGLWRFVERDSDRWGTYTSTAASRPGVAILKILEDEGRYVLNLRYESQDRGAADDWAKLEQDLKAHILPAIRAVKVQPTPDIE